MKIYNIILYYFLVILKELLDLSVYVKQLFFNVCPPKEASKIKILHRFIGTHILGKKHKGKVFSFEFGRNEGKQGEVLFHEWLSCCSAIL